MSDKPNPARTVVNWKDDEAIVVEHAARSSGLAVASFVRAAALRTARKILAEAPTIEALHTWIREGETPPPIPDVLTADDQESS
jgi:uncharacterized protein (DUF1778 family)